MTGAFATSAFTNAPMGVAVLSPRGEVLACNPAVARLLSRVPSQLLGRTFFEVTHEDDLAAAREACADLQAGRTDLMRLECRFLRPDGQSVWVRVSTSRVEAAAGRPAHLVMHLEDIDGHKALQAELTHRALHDPLTGLPNRTLLLDRIAHALERTRRHPTPTCLFFLDLDGFKAVNDTYGHAAGDELLCQLGARLQQVLRSGDTAARLGGDEFAVLCEDTDPDQAALVGARLREVTSASFLVAGARVVLTAAVGLSSVDGAGPLVDGAAGAGLAGATALLHQADLAMYEVKRLSRT